VQFPEVPTTFALEQDSFDEFWEDVTSTPEMQGALRFGRSCLPLEYHLLYRVVMGDALSGDRKSTMVTHLVGALFTMDELGWNKRRRSDGPQFVHDNLRDMPSEAKVTLMNAIHRLDRAGLAQYSERVEPHEEVFIWPTPRGNDLVRALRDYWISQYEQLMPERGWSARRQALLSVQNTPALVAAVSGLLALTLAFLKLFL
jgi:hypothetical protein